MSANAHSAPDELSACSPARRTWLLFLISVLGLFLEMVLIRWIGTEVRIFAYLQNTVLVVCFLGLGMGCMTSRQPFSLREMLLPLFVVVLLLAVPFTRSLLGEISQMLSVLSDLVIWYEETATHPAGAIANVSLGLAATLGLMFFVWSIFVPIGRLLGRLMDDHPRPIWAYSVNVAGSLLGIWLFVLLGTLYQPPIVWFAIVAVCGLFLLGIAPKQRAVNVVLLVGIVALSWLAGLEKGAEETLWSPYQKLTLRREGVRDRPDDREYVIRVNNVGYQAMPDLSQAGRRDDSREPAEAHGLGDGLSQYDLPALLHPRPETMLIVGAGSGNDAAGALRHGVQGITAVDIDPAILALGRKHHPERPYDSPRVRIVNDDARSFFATCGERFDVITFGLLDSHTTTAMTNARLDHYVYTRESIEQARTLLREGGVMVLTFLAQRDYIADRMARVLREVFGQEPIAFHIPQSGYCVGGVMFVVGDLEAARRQLDRNPRLAGLIERWKQERPLQLTGTTPVATDDWPYIYLKGPSIPVLYFLLLGMLVLLFARGVKMLKITGLREKWDRGQWHFFFLGAAFLLLEVQNISKAAVVLGNTWQVNAVIISAILALILLANGLVARFPALPIAPVYVLLCGSCLALYFVDISRFGFLPYGAKAAIVGGLTSLPMLFSGIVFIRSFAVVARKDLALGANLVGALVGGVLQSITFVIGIKALLLIVAGFYLAAVLTRPRARRAASPTATQEALRQPAAPPDDPRAAALPTIPGRVC